MFPNCPEEINTALRHMIDSEEDLSSQLNLITSSLSQINSNELSAIENQRLNEIQLYLNYLYQLKKTEFTESEEDGKKLIGMTNHPDLKRTIHFKRIKNKLISRKFKALSLKKHADYLYNGPFLSFKEIESKTNQIRPQITPRKVELSNKKRSKEIFKVKSRTSWFFESTAENLTFSIKSINAVKTYEFSLLNTSTGEMKVWKEEVSPKKMKDITISTVRGEEYELFIKNIDWYFIKFPNALLLWIDKPVKVGELGEYFINNSNNQDLSFVIENKKSEKSNFYTLDGRKLDIIKQNNLGNFKVEGSNNQVIKLEDINQFKLDFTKPMKLYLNSIVVH